MDRRLARAALLFLLPLASAACSKSDGDDDDPVATLSGTDILTYSNGHPLATDTADPVILDAENQMLTLGNDHRVSLGLNALVDESALRKTARAQSKHMSVHDYFDHVNPEGDNPSDRLNANGISWRSNGENLAAGYDNVHAAFSAWLTSPGHRDNIENPAWTHTGTGYWSGGGRYGTYYTQVFVLR